MREEKLAGKFVIIDGQTDEQSGSQVPAQGPLFFWLRNYHTTKSGDDLSLAGFRIEPDLPPAVKIADIKVGKNSQLAASGYFSAALLNMLPLLNFDPVSTGMNVSFECVIDSVNAHKTYYRGRVTAVLRETHDHRRNYLLPIGRASQIPGRVSEIIAVPDILDGLKKGDITIYLRPGTTLPPHQEQPERPSLSVVLDNDHIVPASPLTIGIGDDLDIVISHRGQFLPPSSNLVAILTPKN